MADNLTAPATGATLATDEIGGVHYPRSKFGFGGDGAYTDVSTSSPLPVTTITGFATAAKQDEMIAAIEAIPGGAGGGGDASAANQVAGNDLLAAIEALLDGAVYYPATQQVSGTVGISGTVPVSGNFYPATQPVSIAAPVAVTGDFYPATQPVSGSVSITGSVAVTGTFWQTTQPISAAALPLPTGAATSAKQDEEIAAIGRVGTRAYAAGVTRLSVSSANAASAAITATEVLLHASAKMYIRAGAAATTNDIPLEAGEKFHMRITSGQTINAIRDTADGTLNIVPVA